MTKGKTLSNGGNEPSIEIVEFSVVVIATENNPSILNPEFLKYNEIVDPNWQEQESPVSTPVFGQVSFKGGLTVKADQQRVIFEQPGDGLVVPEVAKRYFQQVPYIRYSGIGINPKFLLRSTGEHLPLIGSVMHDQGAWMSFKDIKPTIQLKLTYNYKERIISLDVFQIEHGILFQANVHRDVDGPNAQARNEHIQSILDRWEDDLEDVRLLCKTLLGGMK